MASTTTFDLFVRRFFKTGRTAIDNEPVTTGVDEKVFSEYRERANSTKLVVG
jgi:hypothetical protein